MNPIERAINALMEARQDIENWAWFSTEEIRNQYDLDSMLHRVDADIAELRQALSVPEKPDNWVGLTEDEREFFRKLGFVGVLSVEAKLKEKNSG